MANGHIHISWRDADDQYLGAEALELSSTESIAIHMDAKAGATSAVFTNRMLTAATITVLDVPVVILPGMNARIPFGLGADTFRVKTHG